MRNRFATLALAALALTACTAGARSTLLPNVQTGKCYRVDYAVTQYMYVLAKAIDGWRCEGLAEGDVPLPEDGPRPTTAAAPNAPPPAAPPPAKGAAPVTWATGE